MFITSLKLACLALYGAAVLFFLLNWTAGPALLVQLAAAFVLCAHALEALLCRRLLQRYAGPVALSVLLTVLFGLLHLLPLRKAPPGGPGSGLPRAGPDPA